MSNKNKTVFPVSLWTQLIVIVCLSSMSLWEVAEFLKKNGVINAINLDGGGSSTYVMDGSLASYPSDHWWAN